MSKITQKLPAPTGGTPVACYAGAIADVWPLLQKIYTITPTASPAQVIEQERAFTYAIPTILCQIDVNKSPRLPMFRSLITYVNKVHSVAGLETIFLTLLYALRAEAAADVHAGIAAWNAFAGKANTINGAGPMYFFNVEDATLSRLTPAAATHLRSGLELSQLNTLGIEVAKAARFVFPDVFSRHKAVIGDGPGMHHPPVHAPVHPSLESIPHVPPHHVPESLDPKPTLVSHPLEEKIPKPPVHPPPSDGQVEFELEFNFWLGLGAFVVAGVGLALAFTAAPAVIALTVAGAVGGLVIAGLNLGLQAFKLFQFELEKAPPGGYFTPQGFVPVHGHVDIAPPGTTGSGPGASGPGSAGGGGFGGTDGQGRPTLTAPVNQPNTSGPASSHPTGGGGVIPPPQAPGTQPNHPDTPEIPDGDPPLPGGGGGGGGGGGQHPTVPEGGPQQPQDPIEDPPQNPTHPTEPPPTGPPEPPPTTPTPNDPPSSNPPSQPSQPHSPSAPAPPKTPNEPPEPPPEPEGGGGGGGIAAGSHPTISVNPSRGSSGGGDGELPNDNPQHPFRPHGPP